MSVLGSLVVNRVGQVEVPRNSCRLEIEILAYNLLQLVCGKLAGPEGIDKNAQGLRDANGVRQLDEDPVRKPVVHK